MALAQGWHAKSDTCKRFHRVCVDASRSGVHGRAGGAGGEGAADARACVCALGGGGAAEGVIVDRGSTRARSSIASLARFLVPCRRGKAQGERRSRPRSDQGAPSVGTVWRCSGRRQSGGHQPLHVTMPSEITVAIFWPEAVDGLL